MPARTPPVRPADPPADPAPDQLLQLVGVLGPVREGGQDGVRQLGGDLVEGGVAAEDAAGRDLGLGHQLHGVEVHALAR